MTVTKDSTLVGSVNNISSGLAESLSLFECSAVISKGELYEQ